MNIANSKRSAHLTITDADSDRFAIPESAFKTDEGDLMQRMDVVGFKYSLRPFGFSFSDPKEPTNVFFDTTNQTLVFTDKFIQMDIVLPTQRLFGLGERVHELQLQEGTWTMWATGQSNYDDGTGRLGSYGVHPFMLIQGTKKDEFIGLYFKSSNAMSPVIRYLNDSRALLSYITLGGQLDVYFMMKGSVRHMIQEYHQIIGAMPRLPPLWAMGWQ